MFYKKKAIEILDIQALLRSVLAGLMKEFDKIKVMFKSKNEHEKEIYNNKIAPSRLIPSLTKNTIKPIFSEKELAFLQLSCADLTYKEIALKMNVSHRTVENYRESLFLKLHIKSRTALVVYGIKNELIKI